MAQVPQNNIVGANIGADVGDSLASGLINAGLQTVPAAIDTVKEGYKLQLNNDISDLQVKKIKEYNDWKLAYQSDPYSNDAQENLKYRFQQLESQYKINPIVHQDWTTAVNKMNNNYYLDAEEWKIKQAANNGITAVAAQQQKLQQSYFDMGAGQIDSVLFGQTMQLQNQQMTETLRKAGVGENDITTYLLQNANETQGWQAYMSGMIQSDPIKAMNALKDEVIINNIGGKEAADKLNQQAFKRYQYQDILYAQDKILDMANKMPDIMKKNSMGLATYPELQKINNDAKSLGMNTALRSILFEDYDMSVSSDGSYVYDTKTNTIFKHHDWQLESKKRSNALHDEMKAKGLLKSGGGGGGAGGYSLNTRAGRASAQADIDASFATAQAGIANMTEGGRKLTSGNVNQVMQALSGLAFTSAAIDKLSGRKFNPEKLNALGGMFRNVVAQYQQNGQLDSKNGGWFGRNVGKYDMPVYRNGVQTETQSVKAVGVNSMATLAGINPERLKNNAQRDQWNTSLYTFLSRANELSRQKGYSDYDDMYAKASEREKRQILAESQRAGLIAGAKYSDGTLFVNALKQENPQGYNFVEKTFSSKYVPGIATDIMLRVWGENGILNDSKTSEDIMKAIFPKVVGDTMMRIREENIKTGGDILNSAVSLKAQQGMVEKGNIDLTNRPIVKNSDGSISTVRSMSFQPSEGKLKGKEVLIPTVSDNGKIMTEEQAIANFYKTGKHLGAFDTPGQATEYANKLHNQQEQIYSSDKSKSESNKKLGQTYKDEYKKAPKQYKTDYFWLYTPSQAGMIPNQNILARYNEDLAALNITDKQLRTEINRLGVTADEYIYLTKKRKGLL